MSLERIHQPVRRLHRTSAAALLVPQWLDGRLHVCPLLAKLTLRSSSRHIPACEALLPAGGSLSHSPVDPQLDSAFVSSDIQIFGSARAAVATDRYPV